jgi:hypothetical protein
MFTRCSAVTFLLLLVFASTFGVAAQPTAQPNEDSVTLEAVVSKLDAIIRRIEALEQRISNLEASVVGRMESEYIGAVGLYRIDKHGFLYDDKGKRIGIWGVNGVIEQSPRTMNSSRVASPSPE